MKKEQGKGGRERKREKEKEEKEISILFFWLISSTVKVRDGE